MFNTHTSEGEELKTYFVILENEDIVMIKKIYKLNSKNDSTIKLSVVKFLTVNNLFTQPVLSRLIGVVSVKTDHLSNAYEISLTNNEAIVISLCHNYYSLCFILCKHPSSPPLDNRYYIAIYKVAGICLNVPIRNLSKNITGT
ncbi:THAP-type domain-containing protein [Aphis craccivora]|uniref:THAP-type domain-containing protein n=1 Tax=Aphis craccivora TaxID=307492 RepID=A0A6G0VV04_APHCR|nr:THAP-type domain-containing protein [Aphis craccivora]